MQVFCREIGVVNAQVKGVLQLFTVSHHFNSRKVTVTLKMANFENCL